MKRALGLQKALFAALCVLPLLGQASGAPRDTVEALHAALLDLMREAEVLGYAGRREQIEPVILESFDLPYVSRLLVREAWGDLPETQRQRMRDTFAELTVATYAKRFDGYSGQTFVTNGEREVRGKRRLVSTELRTPGEEPVRIDYLLHERGGAWRIVNVIADGVSELALKKTEYATIIRGQGFDALLVKLEARVRELELGEAT